MFNVTLLDPSFTRQDFLFIEGKSKAKLTFGTMKPNTSAYVDLDMEARNSFKLKLKKARITYDLVDEVMESIEAFEDDVELEFKNAKVYHLGNANYLSLLAGFLVLGVAPVLYSNRLKKKRVKIYKSN